MIVFKNDFFIFRILKTVFLRLSLVIFKKLTFFKTIIVFKKRPFVTTVNYDLLLTTFERENTFLVGKSEVKNNQVICLDKKNIQDNIHITLSF